MDVLESKILNGQILSAQEIDHLCTKAISILVNEPNIPSKSSPITIVGDIHGQFFDLLNIFKKFGSPKHTRYVFLGDYVDRGVHSVETLSLLLIYKVMYPDNMTILRGNHESNKISSIYGFSDEVRKKYGDLAVYRAFCEVFEYLVLGCIVDGRLFCVHGGISSSIINLDDFVKMPRFYKAPEKSKIGDLLWSDPSQQPGFTSNVRGTGCAYGNDVVIKFLMVNQLQKIIRSHQLVMEGYKFNFKDESVATVWSAPNYCYRCGNIASVLMVDGEIRKENFKLFVAVDDQAPGYDLKSLFFR